MWSHSLALEIGLLGIWGFGVDDNASDMVMELRRLSLGLLPSESA